MPELATINWACVVSAVVENLKHRMAVTVNAYLNAKYSLQYP